MTKEDIGKVAVGAPALQQVIVASVPDCLLVRQWSRAGREDGDAAAAHLGSLFRAAADTLVATGARAESDLVTIEARESVVVMAPLGAEMIAGFVFDRAVPLGLARVQVRQLAAHLGRSVPPPRAQTGDLPPPIASEVPFDAPSPPDIDSEQAAPTTFQPPRPSALAQAAAPAPSEAPERPRAVRLLEFFRRYAPDPHASMLRLSLRTGISLEALERPDSLAESEVDAVAGAVRDILGQDNVGV